MEENTELNFLDNMIDEVCEILITSETIDWPYELSLDQRRIFLERLIDHYTKKEEYIKCSKLKSIHESLINDIDSLLNEMGE